MEALEKVGYGLYVLTAHLDNKDNGCIINTVMQTTSNPKTLVIAVNKDNYTCDMIQKTGIFNISVISIKADFSFIKHFGFQSGKDVDKLVDYVDKKVKSNGVMCITNNTNACICCKVVDEIDMGTHIMFIADITDEEVFNDDESVTYDYYHKNIKEKPIDDGASTGYVCKICGYVYEGDELPQDFICPWCKHGVEDFEKR